MTGRLLTLVELALVCLISLAGCGSAADSGNSPAVETATLGKSLIGETCQSKPIADAGAGIDIFCGEIEHPAGSLNVARRAAPPANDSAARRDAVERAFKESKSGAAVAARLNCQPGLWLAAADRTESLFIACFSKDGNWPHIVLVTTVERNLFIAEGLPSLLPVLEKAIAGAAGRPVAFAEPASAIKQLEAAIRRPLPLLGAVDFAGYQDLMRAARLYNSEQDFAAAEKAERRALAIEARLFGAASPAIADALMALALDVSNQGRFEESASLLDRAEAIVQRSADPADRSRLAAYRAIDAANRGRYADGLKYAEEATALQRTGVTTGLDQTVDPNAVSIGAANPTGSLAAAHSLMLEASMALRLGDLPKAEAAATEALNIFTEARGLPLWWRAEALIMMGDINTLEERYAAAERDYRDALEFRQRIFGDSAPTAVAAMKLSSLYVREELYPAAVASFRLALGILEHDKAARAELTADEITPFLRAAAITAARDADHRPALDEDVFRAAQLINSGIAAQTLAKASASLAIGDPTLAKLVRSLQDVERQRDAARVELADETAKPDDERSAEREQKLAREVASTSAQADLLSQEIKDKFPGYGKIIEPGAVKLDEMRRMLGPGEALLSFVIGRERAFAILVRSSGLAIHPLDIGRIDLVSDVTDLRRAFVPHGTTLEPYDLNGAFALYQKLLAPVAENLKGVNHLIFIATGPLASLPLGLLIDERPTLGQDYRRAAWLIHRFAVSEVSSVRAFVALRTAPQSAAASSKFLGLGDPAFTGTKGSSGSSKAPSALDRLATQCRDGGPAPSALLREMAPLPDTANELNTIARLIGAQSDSVVLGAAATEAAFRSHHPEQYRVLYFATHGLLPGELRCQTEPALVLSPPPRAPVSKAEDGLLEASEIAALHLHADLVVLSACNTAAAGGHFGGQALTGLADSFFYAGARTLVASHWQVPSAATAGLMTRFFQRLGPDLSHGIAESLRQAQLEMLEQPQTAHPFFWAAFTVIGDGGREGASGAPVASAARWEPTQ